MSGIQLTQFYEAKPIPSKRLTRCKNCDDWSGDVPVKTPIPAGMPRVVVMAGFGPASRHLTLCPNCARIEASRLEGLARRLRHAADSYPRPCLEFTEDDIPF